MYNRMFELTNDEINSIIENTPKNTVELKKIEIKGNKVKFVFLDKSIMEVKTIYNKIFELCYDEVKTIIIKLIELVNKEITNKDDFLTDLYIESLEVDE